MNWNSRTKTKEKKKDRKERKKIDTSLPKMPVIYAPNPIEHAKIAKDVFAIRSSLREVSRRKLTNSSHDVIRPRRLNISAHK